MDALREQGKFSGDESSVDWCSYLSVMEAVPTGIVVVRDDGIIAIANRQTHEIFDYPDGALVGKPIEALIPSNVAGGHLEWIHAYFTDPKPRLMGSGRDLHGARRDGSEFPVEIGLNPLVTSEGLHVLATITDITTRKAAEVALRRSNESLEEFAYIASHDLRSPLRSIYDLLTWIREDLGADVPSSITKNLDRAEFRIRTLEKLVDDLLTYARAGIGGHTIEDFDPRALVDELIELQVPAGGVRVTNEIPSLILTAQKTPIGTVLRNLIANSIGHHDLDHGEVRIRLHVGNGLARFAVTDDGPGIPPEAGDRIFKLFQTASGSDTRGGGVGLAVAKRLVEAHQGTIWLENNNGQRGTTFHFHWPTRER